MTSAAPRCLQRHRSRGHRLPVGAVDVGRPARWGNPYRVEQRNAGVLREGLFLDGVLVCDDSVQVTWPDPVTARRACVPRAVELVDDPAAPGRSVAESAGHDLACRHRVARAGDRWPCHADVVFTLAYSGGVA